MSSSWRRAAPRMLVLGLLLACANVFVLQQPAHACRCQAGTTQDAATTAEVVFTGTVVETALPTPDESGRIKGMLTYTVDVERIYKDDTMVTATTRVATPAASATCGLGTVEPGTEFVFFATVRAGQTGFRATSCDGSGPATGQLLAQVEQELGPGRAVVSDTERPEPTYTVVESEPPRALGRVIAPGGALVLIGLLGLVLTRLAGTRR